MVKAAITLASLMLTGAALAAPESLMKVDAAKGEILLEVQANGLALASIASVTTGCDIGASGTSKSDAQKQLADRQSRLREAFKSEGVKGFTLDFSSPLSNANYLNSDVPIAMTVMEAAIVDVPATGCAEDGDAVVNKPVINLTQRVKVTVADMSELGKARYAFTEAECNEDYSLQRRPIVEMADSSSAQMMAKAQAIAAANAEAESYAAALGMRVMRIIRISESGAIREFFGPESEYIMEEIRRDRDRRMPVSNQLPVTASIAVDFALGPKR
jgi:uncharacterized protein YggE